MTSSSIDAPSSNTPAAIDIAFPYPIHTTLPCNEPTIKNHWDYIKGSKAVRNSLAIHIIKIREPMSGLTHGIGALIAVVGLIFLVLKTIHPIRPWHLATYTVFGISMILLYTASTLFHSLRLSDEGILRLRKLDHIMIFVFIAATYTPFCLIPFRGAFGWSIFAGIWSLVALGTVLKLFWIHMSKTICLSLYFCAGFFELVGAERILRTLQPWAIIWLIIGGMSYCIGAFFYALESDKRPPFFGSHEIFHIFVMIGSSAHFWVLYKYIIAFN